MDPPNNTGHSANEEIKALELESIGMKKENGKNKGLVMMMMMALMICIIVIMGLGVAASLLIRCQQLDDKIGQMQEQIKEIGTIMGLNPIRNVLNPLDCDSKLIISGNRLIATLIEGSEWNSVRTIWPIQASNFGKSPISFYYFEVEFHIMKKSNIHIGFCTKQFPVPKYGKWLGEFHSFGLWYKKGIFFDGYEIPFQNAADDDKFKQGDVAGLGIIHSTTNSSMTQCFATLNGKLLGKIDLPPKYATIESIHQLYPAISMYNGGDSIRANFGTEQFRFNVFTEFFFQMPK